MFNTPDVRPALWSGSASSLVDLSPSTGVGGHVQGVWQAEQVGDFAGVAALWHGTAASFTSLNPAGAVASVAYATREGQQVGYANLGAASRAALWRGSAASWVDLHPAGAGFSIARATDGTGQGGEASFPSPFGDMTHAALWSGSAASFRDLQPATVMASSIYGMALGQQVGWTQVRFEGRRAALWTGTTESWVNLHPFPGFGDSVLNATVGFAQVGRAHVPGGGVFPHAGLWFGTAASFVDLNQYLPPGFGSAAATSVDWYNGQLWIGGWAVDAQNQSHAFVWIGIPAPGALPLLALAGLAAARRRR